MDWGPGCVSLKLCDRWCGLVLGRAFGVGVEGGRGTERYPRTGAITWFSGSSGTASSTHASAAIANRVARFSSKLRDVLVRATGSPSPKLSRRVIAQAAAGGSGSFTGAVYARRATGRTRVLDATDTVQSDAGDTGEIGDAPRSADLRGVCAESIPSSAGADPDSAENCDISAREARLLFARAVGGP